MTDESEQVLEDRERVTEEELQSRFYRSTFGSYELVLPNTYVHWGSEMDIMAMRKSGFVHEIEIKLSKADYLNDFRKTIHVQDKACYLRPWALIAAKRAGSPMQHDPGSMPVDWPKHEVLAMGDAPANYFSFLVPWWLAEKIEVPDHAGLMYAHRDRRGILVIVEVKKPPRLHNRKLSEHRKYDMCRKMMFRYWNKV